MGSGFFFILGIVLSNTYRPYIYENHIFDFHLADTIGNLVAVPSLSLLLLAMRKYESLSKAILYSIFVFTLLFYFTGTNPSSLTNSCPFEESA